MRALVGALGVLLLSVTAAAAADWGSLVPSKTTPPEARARFGAPTRTEVVKIETYDTDRWTYEGAQAPAGTIRLVLEFGLKDERGYRRELLRAFRIEPKRGVFNKGILVNGWGEPDQIGRDGDKELFIWASGLIAYFDTPSSLDPRLLLFGIPQPLPAPATDPRPAPAPAPR